MVKIKVSAFNQPYIGYLAYGEYVEVEITEQEIKQLAVTLLQAKYEGQFKRVEIESVELK